jgi:hypothetical protein
MINKERPFHLATGEASPPKGTSGVSTTAGTNPVPVKLNEKVRRYQFSDTWFTLYDVTELIVSESGNHRIKTKDGKLHIISPGWVHIEITPGAEQEWTV